MDPIKRVATESGKIKEISWMERNERHLTQRTWKIDKEPKLSFKHLFLYIIGLIRPPRTGPQNPNCKNYLYFGPFETRLKPYQKHAAPHPSFYQKVHPDNLFGNQFGEETHYNTWQTQPDNFDKPSHRFQPKPDAATYGQGMVHYLI